MSIISSSKIQQKVKNLLLHLEKSTSSDGTAQPSIVVLSAKASVGGKLVSIIEIAKKAVEKKGGKWWQYSRLCGRIMEMTKEDARGAIGGLTEGWKQNEDLGGEVDHVMSDAGSAKHGDGDRDDDGAFETMGATGRPKSISVLSKDGARKKFRAVPVMSIYISSVAVPELKYAYG